MTQSKAPQAEGEPRPLTVGDIRKRIAGVPDEMPVCLEILTDIPEDEDEESGVQALLRHASIESGHDGHGGVPLLYLWGSSVIDEDEQEVQAPPGRGSPEGGGPAPSGNPTEAGPEDG